MSPPLLRGALLAPLVTAACVAPVPYEPSPLHDADVVATLLAERDAARVAAPDAVTFDDAVAWLRADGPDLRAARARHERAVAVAGVPTPWPDPVVGLGLLGAQGNDVSTNHVVPFGSLSFTIPSGDRLAVADDLLAARAEAARLDVLATDREAVLDLRARFADAVVATRRTALADELVAAAEAAYDTARVLVDVGAFGGLDLSGFELQRAHERGAALDAERRHAAAVARTAALVGRPSESLASIDVASLPAVPAAPPSWDDVQRLVVAEHPALLRLRAEHLVAEQALRLEVARQDPDVTLGPQLGAEPGERRTNYGLMLGWRLPLFDRNRQGVAAALAARDEIVARHEAEARRVLAEVDAALVDVRHATARRAWFDAEVVPAARRHADLARRGLDAGAASATDLLDAADRVRRALADRLDALAAEHAAWARLERAVGVPLTRYPGEAAWPTPFEGDP